MSEHCAYALPFGAEFIAKGRARFRFWAPDQQAVVLEIEGQQPRAMKADAGGWFHVEAECEAGAAYRYRLVANDLAVPDPAARLQAADIPSGASVVVDPRTYAWRNARWEGRPWTEAVLYECHVGALGGFRGVVDHLPHLASIGITAIELMPIADFPGRRNWGYDGALPYAPDTAYGTPEDLKALIDAAHDYGLMIFLDVVYNHFGPVGNHLGAYASPFFREDVSTPWGVAIDFRRPEVRDFFIENAIYWLMEYRFDGLRFDAVHTIAEADILIELAERVRRAVEPDRHIHLVLENDANVAHYFPRHFDAQWNDDAHHVLHVLLTGESEGYYEDYARDTSSKLARCLSSGFAYQGEPSPHRGNGPRGEPSGHLPPTCFIHFLQNHDQIGNRAFGERLTTLAHPEALEAAMALILLEPQIPLLFMGEEWGSRTPFLYFASHEGTLAQSVREGRQREFSSFRAFRDPARRALIPDPNDPETFTSSCPDFLEMEHPGNAMRLALVRNLLAIRHREIIPRLEGTRSQGAAAIGPAAVSARWRLGDGAMLSIILNLANKPISCESRLAGEVLFQSHEGDAAEVTSGIVPSFSLVATLERQS